MRPEIATYLGYLDRHRKFVREAAQELGVSDRGVKHDLSKYEPDEFKAYAEYFYGEWRDRNLNPVPAHIQDGFDYAWLLHQKRNDHHWQYWVLREDSGAAKPLAMPELAVREMVADWVGAGRAIHGMQSNALDWYNKNKDKMVLHSDTRFTVVKLLEQLNQ
jgi:hypothetical protein